MAYHKREIIMAEQEVSSYTRPLVGLVVTQGVLAILFGIAALFWPGATASIVATLFGMFVLIWGISLLVQSLIGIGKTGLWWLELVFGIAVLGLGVYLVRNPDTTLAWLILFIGFTFVIRGVVDLVQAFFSNDIAVRENKLFYIISALLGLAAGVVVLLHPAAGGLAFLWVVGLYAIVQGVVLIVLANKFQALVED